MAGVVFYFEANDLDVYSGRRVDLDAWNYACKIAGDIDSAIIINETEVPLPAFDVTMDIQVVDARPEIPGRVVELVPPWRSGPDGITLWEYDHDVDWYVFGPARGQSPSGPHVYVPQSGTGAMHSVHVASVVMAHRFSVAGKEI